MQNRSHLSNDDSPSCQWVATARLLDGTFRLVQLPALGAHNGLNQCHIVPHVTRSEARTLVSSCEKADRADVVQVTLKTSKETGLAIGTHTS
jgi:hypothetical protein